MIKKYNQKGLIIRTNCICNNKLKRKINFGNLPLINNYKTKKNLIKYPVVICQCENCLLIQLKYSVSDKFLFPNNYSYLSLYKLSTFHHEPLTYQHQKHIVYVYLTLL